MNKYIQVNNQNISLRAEYEDLKRRFYEEKNDIKDVKKVVKMRKIRKQLELIKKEKDLFQQL